MSRIFIIDGLRGPIIPVGQILPTDSPSVKDFLSIVSQSVVWRNKIPADLQLLIKITGNSVYGTTVGNLETVSATLKGAEHSIGGLVTVVSVTHQSIEHSFSLEVGSFEALGDQLHLGELKGGSLLNSEYLQTVADVEPLLNRIERSFSKAQESIKDKSLLNAVVPIPFFDSLNHPSILEDDILTLHDSALRVAREQGLLPIVVAQGCVALFLGGLDAIAERQLTPRAEVKAVRQFNFATFTEEMVQKLYREIQQDTAGVDNDSIWMVSDLWPGLSDLLEGHCSSIGAVFNPCGSELAYGYLPGSSLLVHLVHGLEMIEILKKRSAMIVAIDRIVDAQSGSASQTATNARSELTYSLSLVVFESSR